MGADMGWLGNRVQSVIESDLRRTVQKLEATVDDRDEEVRIVRHDLSVEQSKSAALEQEVEFLNLSLEAAMKRLELMIATFGHEVGRLTQQG